MEFTHNYWIIQALKIWRIIHIIHDTKFVCPGETFLFILLNNISTGHKTRPIERLISFSLIRLTEPSKTLKWAALNHVYIPIVASELSGVLIPNTNQIFITNLSKGAFHRTSALQWEQNCLSVPVRYEASRSDPSLPGHWTIAFQDLITKFLLCSNLNCVLPKRRNHPKPIPVRAYF